MRSKDGLMYHLTCLMYVPYLGKLQDPENHVFSLRYPNARKLNVKL